jgi:hypothetical protein
VTVFQEGAPTTNQKPASLLGQLSNQAQKPSPLLPLLIGERLARWQTDRDLVSLREEKELGKLSTTEQADWRQLWTDVRSLEKQAHACLTVRRYEGSLTALRKLQVQEVKLQAGKTYIIDLESTAFDPYLILADDQGRKLAENDDIEPPVNLNSRIVFTPQKDGSYRLMAASYRQIGTGAFTLTVRTVRAPAPAPRRRR